MTSHDVVYRVRRITGAKKVGHTGTLDPDATGLLLIAFGDATRISDYLIDQMKVYRAECCLGISTTTEDATGEVIEQISFKQPDIRQIKEVLNSFIGSYDQIPPMYSAIKVDGQPLYKLARKGEHHARSPRVVEIYDIHLNDYSAQAGRVIIDFTVSCSKGTYIRTLSVDIGKRLGLPAHMSKLERSASGKFNIDQAYSLAELEQIFCEGELNDILIPLNEALSEFSAIAVSDEVVVNSVYNGKQLFLDEITDAMENHQPVKILNENNQLVALYHLTAENKFMPIKVFKYGGANGHN
jgi:tRNA pseudouridine55 synthase